MWLRLWKQVYGWLSGAAFTPHRARDPRHQLGLRGEAAAESHLRQRGLRVIARRFATRAGEIDLIMSDRACVVFVEVKTLTSDRLQDPRERVHPRKRQRLIRAARWFLRMRGWEERAARFDVVTVVIPEKGEPVIDHLVDAFLP